MKRYVTILVIIITLLSLTIVAKAATADPGSESDPLVTKSYVDNLIAQIKGTGGASDSYEAILITAGQKLIGNEGTEIILRSGEATAIDNGANGVSDITAGKDLMTGNWVNPNHLLLVPRSDGRGIAASTDIWVMVRGSYNIV